MANVRVVHHLCAAALAAAALAGCGSGPGTKPHGLSVRQALARHAHGVVTVHGWLQAPADDRMRLCARLNAHADCRGQPSLYLVGVDPTRIDGVSEGCCGLGYRSTREITLTGRLTGRTLDVRPASSGR